MNTFESLVKWLHQSVPTGYTPQLGIADESKVALRWLPGRKDKPAGVTVDSGRVKYLGCTNRCYPSPYVGMDSQPSAITCGMVDIDFEDQSAPITSPNKLIAAVSEAITDDSGLLGSLRSSCGGRGLHVLFRFSTPVLLPANAAQGIHTAVTKHLLRPFVRAIEDAGVVVCKWDSRMFWLWGGKNENLMTTERMIDLPPGLDLANLSAEQPTNRAGQAGGWEGWIGSDEFVRSWLTRLNVRPGLVYVGTVIQKLRELGETVTTRSRCSGDGKPNGYIDVSPGRVSLWTYADGGVVWAAEDIERTLAAMMPEGDEE